MKSAISPVEHQANSIVKQQYMGAHSPLRRKMIDAFDKGTPAYVVRFDFPWSVSKTEQDGSETQWSKEEGIMMEIDGHRHVLFLNRHDYYQDVEIHHERLPTPPLVVRNAELKDVSMHEFSRRIEAEEAAKKLQAYADEIDAMERENASKWVETYDHFVENHKNLDSLHAQIKEMVKDLPQLRKSLSLEHFMSQYAREPSSERVRNTELNVLVSVRADLEHGIKRAEKLLEIITKQHKFAPHLLSGVEFSPMAKDAGIDFTGSLAVMEMMSQIRRNALLLDKGYMVSVGLNDGQVSVDVVNINKDTVFHASAKVDSENVVYEYEEIVTQEDYYEREVDVPYITHIDMDICEISEPDWDFEIMSERKTADEIPHPFMQLLSQFSKNTNPFTVIGINDAYDASENDIEPCEEMIERGINTFYGDHFGANEVIPLEIDYRALPGEVDVNIMRLLDEHCPSVVNELQAYTGKSQGVNHQITKQDYDSLGLNF